MLTLLFLELLGDTHRGNAPGDSPEVYYRRNVMIPFLDHILTEMCDRFGGIHQQTVQLLGLIASIVATSNPTLSIEEVGTLYKADIPYPPLLSTEYRRWKTKWTCQPPDERQDSLQKALRHCDRHIPQHPSTATHCLHLTSHRV